MLRRAPVACRQTAAAKPKRSGDAAVTFLTQPTPTPKPWRAAKPATACVVTRPLVHPVSKTESYIVPNVISQIARSFHSPTLPQSVHDAGETLRGLVEATAYVGEVVSLGYNDAFSKSTIFIGSRWAEFRRYAFLSHRV